MQANLKALVVVLAIALVVYRLLQPLCLPFMTLEAFRRRRNVWLGLTVVAFLSPSFWIYAIVAMVVLYRAGKADENPVALYLWMLHLIPPVAVYIPGLGINALFELSQYRILALFVLLPAALRVSRFGDPALRRFTLGDVLLLAYGILQVALFVPYQTSTHILRLTFLYALDVMLVFYVCSRYCVTRALMKEVLAALCLTCAVMAALAVFEALRGWLLYQGLPISWGVPILWAFLMRGNSVRAQVSAGHALTLGFMFAIGLTAWLYLSSHFRSLWIRLGGSLWMWAGLLASNSRGPWLTAVAAMLTYSALGPSAGRRLMYMLGGCTVALIGLLLLPGGAQLLDSLPFIGSAEQGNVEYRQQLALVSWRVIWQNPLLGSPFALAQLEELRQGQGIIDLVNAYISIALFYGFVGLGLFTGFFVIALAAAQLASRAVKHRDTDLALMGVCLVAGTVATMFMLATVSFIGAMAQFSWILCGLCAAYAKIRFTEPRLTMAPEPVSPRPSRLAYRPVTSRAAGHALPADDVPEGG
jgi:hypothetical protein